MPDDFAPDPLAPSGFDLFAMAGTAMGVFFVIFMLLFGAATVFIIVTIVRNARKAKASGHDLMTMETDLAVKALDSDLLAPAESIETRLARVDALRRAGTISEAEHAQARAAIIMSA